MDSTAVQQAEAPAEPVSGGDGDGDEQPRAERDGAEVNRGERDHAADRRLGIRVIAFVVTLCVLVTGWAAYRAARSGDFGTTAVSARPAPLPAPVPPVLVQQIPSSFTIPGTAPSIPWPSVGEASIEIEGVGSLGTRETVTRPVPIASVAKTMTAYLILTDHPLAGGSSGPFITVSASEAATYADELRQGQSVVKVVAGERISERDALEALMLASADNVAKILARWDAGSVPLFVKSMNRAAAKLGMTHTTYTDPSGLDPATVSTVTDQIRLGEAAMRLASFRAIVGQQVADIPAEGTIANFNRLLGQDGVIGIKTGSTDNAGGCLLFAAVMNVGGQSKTIIGAVLGQSLGTGDGFLSETLVVASKMIYAAQHSLAAATIAPPGIQVASVRRPGAPSERRLTVTSALTVVGKPGQVYRVFVSDEPSSPTLEVAPLTDATGTASAISSSQLVPLFEGGTVPAD
jgi:D-alanyl-D-alanine carboxypeptidase (penicillin-binding protein 5/6)